MVRLISPAAGYAVEWLFGHTQNMADLVDIHYDPFADAVHGRAEFSDAQFARFDAVLAARGVVLIETPTVCGVLRFSNGSRDAKAVRKAILRISRSVAASHD